MTRYIISETLHGKIDIISLRIRETIASAVDQGARFYGGVFFVMSINPVKMKPVSPFKQR
jgi:hypothetical protein